MPDELYREEVRRCREEVLRWEETYGPQTHLLPCNQQDGAFLGVHHLAENVVKDEKLAPAVLEKFHLVVNLKRSPEKRERKWAKVSGSARVFSRPSWRWKGKESLEGKVEGRIPTSPELSRKLSRLFSHQIHDEAIPNAYSLCTCIKKNNTENSRRKKSNLARFRWKMWLCVTENEKMERNNSTAIQMIQNFPFGCTFTVFVQTNSNQKRKEEIWEVI